MMRILAAMECAAYDGYWSAPLTPARYFCTTPASTICHPNMSTFLPDLGRKQYCLPPFSLSFSLPPSTAHPVATILPCLCTRRVRSRPPWSSPKLIRLRVSQVLQFTCVRDQCESVKVEGGLKNRGLLEIAP